MTIIMMSTLQQSGDAVVEVAWYSGAWLFGSFSQLIFKSIAVAIISSFEINVISFLTDELICRPAYMTPQNPNEVVVIKGS